MAYTQAKLLKDGDGNPIPQYYNPVDDEFKPITGENGAQFTQLKGSNVEYKEHKIVDAQSVQAGGELDIPLYDYLEGQDELWIGVLVDVQPWRFMEAFDIFGDDRYANNWYPSIMSEKTTVHGRRRDIFKSMHIGVQDPESFYDLHGEDWSTLNLYEQFQLAKSFAVNLPFDQNAGKVRFINLSTEVATVTIYALQKWRY